MSRYRQVSGFETCPATSLTTLAGITVGVAGDSPGPLGPGRGQAREAEGLRQALPP